MKLRPSGILHHLIVDIHDKKAPLVQNYNLGGRRAAVPPKNPKKTSCYVQQWCKLQLHLVLLEAHDLRGPHPQAANQGGNHEEL